MNIEFIIILHI